MFVGVDFGTSNSSIGLYQDQKLQFFSLDSGHINPNILPSLAYITREHQVSVGSRAVEDYLEQETGRRPVWGKQNLGAIEITVAGAGKGPIVYKQPVIVDVDVAAKGRLLQSVKTILRDAKYEGTQIFGRFYTVEELVAILLAELRRKCEAATEQPVERVVMGRPVKFSDDQQTDSRAEQILADAARLAGFKEVVFELEPIGGAYLFHQNQTERQNILVFDFGGGTLDMTIIEVGGAQPPKTIATQGVLLGGDDLTAVLVQNLYHYFGKGSLLADGLPFPSHIFQMLNNWQNIVELSRPQYAQIIEQAKHGSDSLGAQRLENLANKKLGFKLFRELERVKIGLSSSHFMAMSFMEEELKFSETILRTRFEKQIEKEVQMVDEAIDELMHKSGLKAEQIQAVLRTGGSSEIPVFINLLARRFGEDRICGIDSFTTIVGGLALKAYELSQLA